MKSNGKKSALLIFHFTLIYCNSFTSPICSIQSSYNYGRVIYDRHDGQRISCNLFVSKTCTDNPVEEKNTTVDENNTRFPFHCSPLSSILKELNIPESAENFFERGLGEDQAKERLHIHGMNALPTLPRKTLTELFMEQFDDRLVQILVLVASLSAVSSISNIISSSSIGVLSPKDLLESLIEPTTIILILMLNAAVGVWQQISALESLDALEKLQPRLATVLRYEWISKFDAKYLVPGDIIKVNAGDIIPADVKIVTLESTVFGVDESCLTGESETVFKSPRIEGNKTSSKVPISEQNTMAFSGTTVTQGSAKALVVQTGLNTEIGKVQSGVLSVQEMKTPLGIKLDKFGDDLSIIIAIICVAVWFVSIPRFNDPTFPSTLDGALYYAKVGVALGVAAIPEGLPAVVTLVLSLGTRRLAERNVIVRKLPSVETLGCVSVICTDKTGTLTKNQMTCVSLATFERDNLTDVKFIENPVSFNEVDGIGRDESNLFPSGSISDIVSVCFGCNNAELFLKDGKFVVVGEPTEGALLYLAEKLSQRKSLDTNTSNANKKEWQKNWEKLLTLEFDRERKSMSVLFSPKIEQKSDKDCLSKTKTLRLLVKGAPNSLLDRCESIKLRDGTVVPLTPDLKGKVQNIISILSGRPLRCLLLAVRDFDYNSLSNISFLDQFSDFRAVESNLTIVGIVGIKDPVRENVLKSIGVCKDAGIRVIVISGDAKETTSAIAQELNILSKQETMTKVFTANEFFYKSTNEQLKLLTMGNLVFCRTEPIDKQKIVRMLQSTNEITAMTGDGMNDAPALKQASIGLAMGSGSDVAKEAADMVLVDDSFSTIVNGIEEGRCIYANMQAFINFLISCNVGEVLTVFMASILGFPSVFSAMQLLWVNLVTDGPPAVALGFNPREARVMHEKPRNINEEIMTPWLLVRYFAVGLYISVATLGIFAFHYQVDRAISLDQLSNWSTCTSWCDDKMCESLFGSSGLALPQTLALSTLITTELLKALSTVSVDSSILIISPIQNPYLLLGVAIPFISHLIILYTPLSISFGLVPLSLQEWGNVFVWSFPVILVDEILKAIGNTRKNN